MNTELSIKLLKWLDKASPEQLKKLDEKIQKEMN